MRRMDRYKDEDMAPASRLDKNQELYQNFSNNTIYTNITDVTNANAYDISSAISGSHTTREAYQQMQKYQAMEDVPKTKKELEDFNYLYQRKENKVYDINSVLEEARKNRQEVDEKEEKRRLKNNEYNILSGVNKKELEKYREEKKKKLTTPEEEEIRELIDTIASKTLAGEIDKATSVNLLSDLMATSIMDKVDSSEEMSSDVPQITASFDVEEDEDDKLSLSKKILDTQEVKELQKEEAKETEKVENKDEEKQEDNKTEKDPDFYTRSMDLSDKDFNLSDEFKEEPLPLAVKILIFLVIVSVIALAVYFIYQRIQ